MPQRMSPVNLLSQMILVGLLVVWLVTINARLTLLLLAMSPIAVAIALSFRRVARRVTRRARRVTAKINAQIQESISGIVVAKSFRQERTIHDTFAANNTQAYQVGLRRGRSHAEPLETIPIPAGTNHNDHPAFGNPAGFPHDGSDTVWCVRVVDDHREALAGVDLLESSRNLGHSAQPAADVGERHS